MKIKDRLKAIIADDEALSRSLVRKYLIDFPEIAIVAECENGLTALNAINKTNPDIVFLDIQMPDLDGLSLLKELKTLPQIIFTTAYDQYAIKAFELNAVDYLLKPFDKERFAQAIRKISNRDAHIKNLEKQIAEIHRTLSALQAKEISFITRLLLKGKQGYFFLETKDITWFEGFGNYVKIHTGTKTYLKNISLNELETKLSPKKFIRIHRSTIVNLHFIREMKPYFNGEYIIFLTTGDQLKLSRSHKDKTRLLLDEGL